LPGLIPEGEPPVDHGALPIPIPRGVITGWQEDADQSVYRSLTALGHASGNAQLVNAIRMQQTQPEPPKRRR